MWYWFKETSVIHEISASATWTVATCLTQHMFLSWAQEIQSSSRLSKLGIKKTWMDSQGSRVKVHKMLGNHQGILRTVDEGNPTSWYVVDPRVLYIPGGQPHFHHQTVGILALWIFGGKKTDILLQSGSGMALRKPTVPNEAFQPPQRPAESESNSGESS